MPHIQSHSTGASAEFERETARVLWNPKPLGPRPGRKQSAGLGSGLKKRCGYRWLPYCNEGDAGCADAGAGCSFNRSHERLRKYCRVCIQKWHSMPGNNHRWPASILKPPSAVVLQYERTAPSETRQHQPFGPPIDTQQPMPVSTNYPTIRLAVHSLETTRVKSRITFSVAMCHARSLPCF